MQKESILSSYWMVEGIYYIKDRKLRERERGEGDGELIWRRKG